MCLITSGTNSVFIGNQTNTTIPTGSNQLALGSGAITDLDALNHVCLGSASITEIRACIAMLPVI